MNKKQRAQIKIDIAEFEKRTAQQVVMADIKKDFAAAINKLAGQEIPAPLLDIFMGAMLMELPNMVTEARPHKLAIQKIASDMLLGGIVRVVEAVVAQEAIAANSKKKK